VDETADDAAAFGLELQDLPPPPDEDFGIWPENWSVVEMFLRVQTQWRTTMSGVIGLDYAAVRWLFKLYDVEEPRALLEDLQVMEAAAMVVLNQRSG
jgi:hypothetical protein